MKILIEVEDNKASSFRELIKQYTYVKAKPLSAPDVALLEEIKLVKKAFKNLDKLKSGKLKTRPASDLLDEL